MINRMKNPVREAELAQYGAALEQFWHNMNVDGALALGPGSSSCPDTTAGRVTRCLREISEKRIRFQ